MKSTFVILLLVSITSTVLLGCKKDEVPQQTLAESLSDAVTKVQQFPEISQFSSRLKNAYNKGLNLSSTELEEMSGVTIFATIDNPYWSTDTNSDLNMVKNHIVKGSYHKADLKRGTKLQTITGEEIIVSFYGFDMTDKAGITYINNSIYLEEIGEENGNIIHTVTNPIFCSKDEIDLSITDCKDLLKQYAQFYYLFDAVFTDESVAINSSWDVIDKHTFNTSNDKIERLYYDAYKVLTRLTTLSESFDGHGRPSFITNEEMILPVRAEVLSMQAYLYFCLLTYFENVPLLNKNVPLENKILDYNKLSQSTPTDIFDYIHTYLYFIKEFAPKESNNEFVFNQDAISALEIRNYIYHNTFVDSPQARIIAQKIIDSGKYSLEKNNSIYTPTSSETILEFPIYAGNELGTLYNGRSILPIYRYTSILLDYTWSAIEDGLLANAVSTLNLINQRSGQNAITFPSGNWKEQMKGILFDVISREIKMEGQRFSILKRFNKAEQILNLQTHQKLLPIPQKQILSNPNFTQNPGY